VGLNSDDSIKRIKGPSRPLNTEEDRALLLSSLEVIDYIVIFNEDTPINLLKAIQPNILVKGGDYKTEEVIGREHATETIILPFVDGYSTTKLLDTIQQLKN